MITIKCNKRNAVASELETLTSGSAGIAVRYVFGTEWVGVTKTPVFCCGDLLDPTEKRITTLTNGIAVIPHEVLIEGLPVWAGIYGTSGSTIVIPTIWCQLGMCKLGVDSDGDPSVDPTLPVWAQIESMIGDLDELDTEDKSNLVAAINEINSGGGTTDHTELTNRDADNQHPISAITGLSSTLDNNVVKNTGTKTFPIASLDQMRLVVSNSGTPNEVVKISAEGNMAFPTVLFKPVSGNGNTVLSRIAAPVANTDAANKAYVDDALSDKLDNVGTTSSPAAQLDTLLLKASGDISPAVSAVVSKTSDDAVLHLTDVAHGGTVTIRGITTPVSNTDAATKKYVDDNIPTTLAELDGDSTHRTVTDAEKTTWNGKQAALVSGTNIKTINNQSLLGSGNITISGGVGDKGLFYANGVISSTFTSAFPLSAFPYGVPGSLNDLVVDTKGSIGRVSSITSTHIELQMLVEGAYTKDEVDALLEDKISTDMTATASGLSAGSTPTVSYNAETNVLSFGIPAGATGAQGAAGADGHSPVVTATKSGTVTTIKVDGTAIATINDGAAGADGADGVSPEVSVSTITGGHRVSITDKDHPSGQSFNVMDGAKGETGAAGADGHTPVKGTDYWTAADKQGIVNDVLAALPTWTGGSY